MRRRTGAAGRRRTIAEEGTALPTPPPSGPLIDPLVRNRLSGASPARGRPSLAYGWIVVAAVTAIITATSGARFLFGVVLKPVAEEFGWSRSALTAAVMVSTVVLSLCQPAVGLLVDRVGAKRILVGGTAVIGFGLLPLSFAARLWQVYLLYGVAIAVGLAAASPVVATALVGRWFERRRGTALAIATSGAAFGQLLIVPLGAWTLTVADWQTTYRLLAAILLVAMVPLGLLVLRDAPAASTPAARSVEEAGTDLRGAVRTGSFWLLALGFLVCGFTMAFPNTHFIAYVDDMGMAPTHAANAVGVTAVFSIAGSLLLGMAADRHRRGAVLAATYALRGAAFALLLVLPPAGGMLFVYAVVLGVSWTATTPLTAAIAADIYGRRHLGAIFGSLFTFMNIGYGIGAVLDGVVYELSGGYEAALVVNAALGGGAAVAVWMVADRRRRSAPDGGLASAPRPVLGAD